VHPPPNLPPYLRAQSPLSHLPIRPALRHHENPA
jgi:hypothetical protein